MAFKRKLRFTPVTQSEYPYPQFLVPATVPLRRFSILSLNARFSNVSFGKWPSYNTIVDMSRQDRLETYRRQYAVLKPGWMPATIRYQRWVAEALTSDARILDLGCGRGGIVERLGVRGTWVGVDPDRTSLRAHRVAALPTGQATAHRLPFAERTFDLVVSSWVFEHLSDPAETLAEVGRVLQPGGRLIFLTPNGRHPIPRLSRLAAGLTRLQERLVSRYYSRAPQDTFPVTYRANTFRRIDALAADAGLRLRALEFVADPSYLAWNPATFWLAVGLEALIPASWKVHLVGVYEREPGASLRSADRNAARQRGRSS